MTGENLSDAVALSSGSAVWPESHSYPVGQRKAGTGQRTGGGDYRSRLHYTADSGDNLFVMSVWAGEALMDVKGC